MFDALERVVRSDVACTARCRTLRRDSQPDIGWSKRGRHSARAAPAAAVMRRNWSTWSSHIPGESPAGASRRGAARPAVKRTSVSGDLPCSLFTEKTLRVTRENDASGRREPTRFPFQPRWPATRVSACRIRDFVGRERHLHAAKGKCGHQYVPPGPNCPRSPSAAFLKRSSRPPSKDS